MPRALATIMLWDTWLHNDTSDFVLAGGSLLFVILYFLEMASLWSLPKILVQERGNHHLLTYKFPFSCQPRVLPHTLTQSIKLSSQLVTQCHSNIITWPSPKAGQVLKCRRFFGGVEMVIGWICSRDLFETSWEAYTKYCPLSLPKRAECLRVSFHCLSGVVFVTLNRSCRIRTFTPDAGDHGELFWSGFWLRWFSLLCTHWGQIYWHNASLVPFEFRSCELQLIIWRPGLGFSKPD